MQIPRADLKVTFSSLMDVEPVVWEEVKAGETFYLNLAETGMLISKPEYAGTFTGEGTGVRVTVSFSQNRETPNIALKNIDGGSVKKNMILIADMVGADESRNLKGTPKIKDMFASKFGVLYQKRQATRGTSSAKAVAGSNTKAIAAALESYFQHTNAKATQE